MGAIRDISFLQLMLGYILLIIPIGVFVRFQTGLVKDTVWAVIRMSIQLFLVGLYMEYIFELNMAWINILWGIIMIVIASYTIVRRSELPFGLFLIPVFLAIIVSLLIVDTFFLGAILQLEHVFEARYFIPITGILLGNSLRRNIIALNTYYSYLQRDRILYRYYLANGAKRSEALIPFIRRALKDSFNPIIATMSVTGLISLPGVMTGQILGGSSPSIAIKYQILFMLTIFIASLITVIITILITNYYVFDEYDNLVDKIAKKNHTS